MSGFVAADIDFADEFRVRFEDRTETPVAGHGIDHRECRSTEQDRVAAAIVGVARHDDRRSRSASRPPSPAATSRAAIVAVETRGWSPRTMSAASAVGTDRRQPDPDGTRQASAGIGVADTSLRAPRDRSLERVGVLAEDDHDIAQSGFGESIEDVLEDGSPVQGRRELAAAESTPRSGREDDGRDRAGVHGRHPTCPLARASYRDDRRGRRPEAAQAREREYRGP